MIVLEAGVDLNNIPAIHEVYYGGIDEVHPIPVSFSVADIASSSEELWVKRPAQIFLVILKLVIGDDVPSRWDVGFKTIPEWCWVPVIALRYMLNREPRLMTDGYLDALLATIASISAARIQGSPLHKIDARDRTESDVSNVWLIT